MVSDSPQHVVPFPTLEVAPVRGVRWVLTWAAALAVIGWSAAILFAFACQLAAEQDLSRAAAAGLREATCDRATSHTVEQTIRRRLVGCGLAGQQVSVVVLRNGAPVTGLIRAAAGDRLSVSLSTPVDYVLPAWLCNVSLLGQSGTITVWADHQLTHI